MNFTAVQPIVLASASPRRKELLGLLGLPFEVVPSGYAEDLPFTKEDPVGYAKQLATEKTIAVANLHPDSIVIGADTIVVFEGRQLPKPSSQEEATEFLMRLSGQTHSVITGVCVCSTHECRQFAVETYVTFKDLDVNLIKAYVASGDPMDKAGGYGIQTAGALFVDKIRGDYSNVVGLPIAPLAEHSQQRRLIELKVGEV